MKPNQLTQQNNLRLNKQTIAKMEAAKLQAIQGGQAHNQATWLFDCITDTISKLLSCNANCDANAV
ncbi:hypothetical protein FAM09_23580 [Niastella caeni]|uniref:Class I lanthipeptide n=1 Tax=Niastella caeni TaxID=2569763 RepID=A0A4S8HIU0_9BACT|nr:class I lanthipeptide [Niastella caeni]THU34973.1 hypothetical protein FAM09_23580 [Niastella caeni]